MAEFTIAGPKDSCPDLDCIKTVGSVPIGYSRIAAHARTHTDVKNASGVSNFAQTADGQRGKQIILDTRSGDERRGICMRKQSLVLGVAVLLISGGIASAQIAVPPGQDNPVATPPSVATPSKSHPETSGQNFRDDRLQSDRDSKMVPTPVPPPASAPNVTR